MLIQAVVPQQRRVACVFVLCTNPLPFMGLQPLGYLSYLIAREHISGVPG